MNLISSIDDKTANANLQAKLDNLAHLFGMALDFVFTDKWKIIEKERIKHYSDGIMLIAKH